MSRKILVLSALTLGLIVPASAKVYTREDAIKTAMENSADIKSAEKAPPGGAFLLSDPGGRFVNQL